MALFRTALVAGASGSGKTLIARMFQNAYVHSMDNYFRPPFKTNDHGIPQWDTPEAVAIEEWVTDYHRIKEAIDLKQEIKMTSYDFISRNTCEVPFNGAELENIRWIVIEGLFALDRKLHHLADIKVFVDAPFPLRVSRRLTRDLKERGENDIMFVLMHTYYTEESYRQYILPQKEYADLVIPNYDLSSADLTKVQL